VEEAKTKELQPAPCAGDSDSHRHTKGVESVVGVGDGVETCCPPQMVLSRTSHAAVVAICRKLGSQGWEEAS